MWTRNKSCPCFAVSANKYLHQYRMSSIIVHCIQMKICSVTNLPCGVPWKSMLSEIFIQKWSKNGGGGEGTERGKNTKWNNRFKRENVSVDRIYWLTSNKSKLSFLNQSTNLVEKIATFTRIKLHLFFFSLLKIFILTVMVASIFVGIVLFRTIIFVLVELIVVMSACFCNFDNQSIT